MKSFPTLFGLATLEYAAFVACFCGSRDLRSQWRIHGADYQRQNTDIGHPGVKSYNVAQRIIIAMAGSCGQ